MSIKLVYLRSNLVIILILMVGNYALSQSQYKNGVFFELGGVGGPYSLNYERQFNSSIAGRIGFCYLGNDLLIPLAIVKVFGETKHHFEVNLGVTLYRYKVTAGSRTVQSIGGNQQVVQQQLDEYQYNSLYLTCFVGYRYQKPDRRFFIRVGASPMWRFYNSDELSNNYGFVPWAGTSFGYKF